MALPECLQSYRFVEGAPLEELPDDLELTTKQAAPYCGVKDGTLDKWRLTGRGPAFQTYGEGPKPRVRYVVKDIRAWRAEHYAQRVDPRADSTESETPAR